MTFAPLIIARVRPLIGDVNGASALELAGLSVFLPTALLSLTEPAAAKVQLRSLEKSAAVVGWIAGLASAGAIGGTLVANFIVVRYFRTAVAVRALGLLLVVCGVAFALLNRHTARALAIFILLGVVGASTASSSSCDFETTYHCVTVEHVTRDADLILLDGVANSYTNRSDPLDVGPTQYRAISVAVEHFLHGSARPRALVIGGAALSVPRYLAARVTNSESTVLEIDAALANRFVTYARNAGRRIHSITGDARKSLARMDRVKFDVALGDAFVGTTVPWQLTTREFLMTLRARLTGRGAYVLNLIDGGENRFLYAEVKTLRTVFSRVAVLSLRRGESHHLVNYLVVAWTGRRTVADRAAFNGLERRLTYKEVQLSARKLASAPVLTDEFAPVEQLMLGRGRLE